MNFNLNWMHLNALSKSFNEKLWEVISNVNKKACTILL
jgi:hypothetical protein